MSAAETGLTETLRVQRRNGYEGARRDVLAVVPPSAVSILDLGCSVGARCIPQHWGVPGWRNRFMPLLIRSPLAPLVEAQYVLVAVKPG